MKLDFINIHEQPGVYTSYAVRTNGETIGHVYREHDIMTEWSIDAGLEEVFGENAAAGYARFYDFKRELERLAAEKE